MALPPVEALPSERIVTGHGEQLFGLIDNDAPGKAGDGRRERSLAPPALGATARRALPNVGVPRSLARHGRRKGSGPRQRLQRPDDADPSVRIDVAVNENSSSVPDDDLQPSLVRCRVRYEPAPGFDANRRGVTLVSV